MVGHLSLTPTDQLNDRPTEEPTNQPRPQTEGDGQGAPAGTVAPTPDDHTPATPAVEVTEAGVPPAAPTPVDAYPSASPSAPAPASAPPTVSPMVVESADTSSVVTVGAGLGKEALGEGQGAEAEAGAGHSMDSTDTSDGPGAPTSSTATSIVPPSESTDTPTDGVDGASTDAMVIEPGVEPTEAGGKDDGSMEDGRQAAEGAVTTSIEPLELVVANGKEGQTDNGRKARKRAKVSGRGVYCYTRSSCYLALCFAFYNSCAFTIRRRKRSAQRRR